jgi:hypothetical protein
MNDTVMYDAIQGWFNSGIYSADDVKACSPYWITQEQVNQILGTQGGATNAS